MEDLKDNERKWCSGYINDVLTVVVIGASGDLAKKKTFPALMTLFMRGLLPPKTQIIGYARSNLSNVDLRKRIEPYLLKAAAPDRVKAFLKLVSYQSGQYSSAETMAGLAKAASAFEESALTRCGRVNRLFYFAIPPSVYADVARAIKAAGLREGAGWTRMIIEKPFGRDLESSEVLSKQLKGLFTEDYLYRIDHYLGKEMTQNMLVLRFGNSFLEPLWNNRYVDCVYMSFKEPFGTEGRGGYFDSSGIIRDVMQNHLLQVLSLFAMEAPSSIDDGESIRNEKVKLLKAMDVIKLEDMVVGQYVRSEDGKKPGYLEDDTLKNKASTTPTFASCILRIRNGRWDGVPFIMRAGKALNQRKVDIRVQFKKASGASRIFSSYIPRNELVIRLQPNESIFLRTNVKAPGMMTHIAQSELDLTYSNRYGTIDNPSAYSRLLLDVLRGNSASFVRSDELTRAWEIFTPVLKELEEKKVKPFPYAYGSRGPKEADDLAMRAGYDPKTLEMRLKAGPRDERKGAKYTKREYATYVEGDSTDSGLEGQAAKGGGPST